MAKSRAAKRKLSNKAKSQLSAATAPERKRTNKSNDKRQAPKAASSSENQSARGSSCAASYCGDANLNLSPDSDEFSLPVRFLSTSGDHLASLCRDVSHQLTSTVADCQVRRILSHMRHCTSHGGVDGAHVSTWCHWLINALHTRRFEWLTNAICRTLAQLLVVGITDGGATAAISRVSLTASQVAMLVTSLTRPEPPSASLRCLCQLLCYHGRICASHKSEIQRFILAHVDNSCAAVANEAQRSFSALFNIGPPGADCELRRAAWADLCVCLIKTIHHTLDQLFDGVQQTQSFEVPDVTLLAELRHLSAADPAQLRYLLCCRSVALINCLTNLLCRETKHPVSVPVSYLLDLVGRCVYDGVTSSQQGNTASGTEQHSALLEIQTVRATLPSLHCASFRLLKCLIGCCGRALLMRASQINRLLVWFLSQPLDDTSVAHIDAHCHAMRALNAWLLSTTAGSGLHGNAADLARALLSHVPSLRLVDRVLSVNGPDGAKAKRQRTSKKNAADWLAEEKTSVCRPISDALSVRLARMSLTTLTQLVTSLGVLMPAAIHQELQTFVVGELQCCNWTCQVAGTWHVHLLQLLEALTLSCCTADCQPPLQQASSLFRRGLVHRSPNVVRVCQSGMAVLSRSIHPLYPSLHPPPSLSSARPAAGAQDQMARAFTQPAEPTSDNDVINDSSNQLPEACETRDVLAELSNQLASSYASYDVTAQSTNQIWNRDKACDVTVRSTNHISDGADSCDVTTDSTNQVSSRADSCDVISESTNQPSASADRSDVTAGLISQPPVQPANQISSSNVSGDVTAIDALSLADKEETIAGCHGNAESPTLIGRDVSSRMASTAAVEPCETVTLDSSEDEICAAPSADVTTSKGSRIKRMRYGGDGEEINLASDDDEENSQFPDVSVCSPRSGDDEDPVLIAETVTNLAPDVAEMLKDFVDVCPEVE